MGRRKQTLPHQSGGILEQPAAAAEGELDNHNASETQHTGKNDVDKPFFVEVDRTLWVSDGHRDISELLLTHLNLGQGFCGYSLGEEFYQDSKYSLRLRLCNVDDYVGRIRLGHWPVLSATTIFLEFIEKPAISKDMETHSVILSGSFDGLDDGVSGLVHLASLKFLTLRPVIGVTLSEDVPSLKLRVEILESAFDACESLLDNARQVWKKRMLSVMVWLRPEAMTSEAKYKVSDSTEMELDLDIERGTNSSSISRKHARFDVARFYEAIKPSKGNPMLEDDIPGLLPKLRPYQRRATYWMVQREKGAPGSLVEMERSSPLCVPVDFVNTYLRMFYNPFRYDLQSFDETFGAYYVSGIF